MLMGATGSTSRLEATDMQERDDGTYLLSPTDLVNFLGCAHSTVLDLKAFSIPLEKDRGSDGDLLLRRKGEEHEAAYLQTLKNAGKSVADIGRNLSLADRVRFTNEAMRK